MRLGTVVGAFALLVSGVVACSGGGSGDPTNVGELGAEGGQPPGEPAPDAAGSGPAADGGDPDGATPGEVDAGPPDPCASETPVCPTTTVTEGSGLTSIDRCAFPIKEAPTFATLPGLVTALGKITTPVTMATVLGDLNRTATKTTAVPGSPPGVDIAVRWEAEDEDSTTWIPQGITGSADATATGLVAGKRIVLVSWYYTPPGASTYEKGVRIAIVDVTDPNAPKYRFALLVEPKGAAATPDFAPIVFHAGGMVWIGDRLYVAQTTRGFRVFDMSKIMQVDTTVDEIGCASGTCRGGLYKYIIPQIGTYLTESECAPLFSYVSLDRSTTPPSLLSGEYCSDTACAGPLAGRVYRWPLDASGKLRAGRSWPSEVSLFGQRQVQGAASKDGAYYFSSSAPAAGGGALYRVKKKTSATSTWIDAPEDLMVDTTNGLLWSLSEGAGNRVIMGAKLTSYPPPP